MCGTCFCYCKYCIETDICINCEICHDAVCQDCLNQSHIYFYPAAKYTFDYHIYCICR